MAIEAAPGASFNRHLRLVFTRIWRTSGIAGRIDICRCVSYAQADDNTKFPLED